jgi:hypothetical protein
MTNYEAEAELLDEYNAQWGDPRRCLRHGVTISSNDGMHDGLCGYCEADADIEEERVMSVDDMMNAIDTNGCLELLLSALRSLNAPARNKRERAMCVSLFVDCLGTAMALAGR